MAQKKNAFSQNLRRLVFLCCLSFCRVYHGLEACLETLQFLGIECLLCEPSTSKGWFFQGLQFLNFSRAFVSCSLGGFNYRRAFLYSQNLRGIATKIPPYFQVMRPESWVSLRIWLKKSVNMLSFIIFNVFQISFQLSHWKQSQPPILSERTCRSYQALVDAKSVPYCKTIWTELEVKNMTGVIAGQSHLIIIEMAFSARNKNVSEKTAQQTKTHWFH